MSDRTNPASWPNPRGPWHEVGDLTRVYDHGMPWCLNAAGHPDSSGGYPEPAIHLPADECRTAGLYLDGVTRELTGPGCGLEVYAAHQFRFGELRATAGRPSTRIVVDFFDDSGSVSSARYSLTLGESLRLARRLSQLVDLVTLGR
jgi:hypothetical protein